MTRTLTKSQQVERQTLIRRSVLGLDYWLYGKAFLLPFCDYLKILLNKPDPTVITLWDSADTQRPIFSTHPHIETKFYREGGVVIPNSDRSIACYRSIAGRVVGDNDARLLFERLFAHPDFTSANEGKVFAETLAKATSLPAPTAHKYIPRENDNFTHHETRDWVTAYRRVLNTISKLLEGLPHMRLKDPASSCGANLFSFVFTALVARESQPTRLIRQPQSVLTKEQHEFLRNGPEATTDVAKMFLRIFGKGAEDAFHTGTVTLAAPLQIPDELNEAKWHSFKNLASKHRIYVPIHIEGSPWIVLLRFIDSDRPHWYDIFHFYHDVIPRIGAMLRTEAKALYLDVIERLFADEIAKSDLQSIVSRFNQRSMSLLRNLPFPRIYLTDKSTDGAGEPIDLPDGRRVLIATEPNPYFNPEWTYDPLGGLDTKEACERAKAAFAKEERRIRARFLGHRHSIVNLNPGPLLHAALIQDDTQISGKSRTFVADAEKTSDVLFATLDLVMNKKYWPLQNKGVADILRWLKEKETSGVAHAHLRIEPEADFMPPQDAIEDIFLVFWNLWHNAARSAYDHSQSRTFEVALYRESESRLVAFSQDEVWPARKRQWVDYLNGVAQTPNTEVEPSGLEIVKRSLYHLGWDISAVAAPAVTVKIHIPCS